MQLSVPEGGPTLHTRFDGMLRAGQFDLILEEAARVFADAEPSGEGGPQDRAEAVHIALRACQAAGALGKWGRAVAWADRGLALAEGEAESEDASLLRFLSGTALMYTGDLLRAGRELQRFYQASAAAAGLQRYVGDAQFNLAYLKRCMGQAADELEAFRAAMAAYAAQGRPHRVATCHYEIAWSLLLGGRTVEAEPHLAAAEQMCDASADSESVVDLQTARALYHYLRREYSDAEAICRSLKDGPELPHRQQADVFWLLGLLALAAGDARKAGQYAGKACEAAAEDWWPPQIERLSAFQQKVSAGKAPVG